MAFSEFPNLDASIFDERIGRLYRALKDEDDKNSGDCSEIRFPKINAVVCCTSKRKEDFHSFKGRLTLNDNMVYCKSSTFQRWLFDNEFIQTIIVLTQKAIFILTSYVNTNVFKQLQERREKNIPPVTFLFCKDDDDYEQCFVELINGIKSSGEGNIGIFENDNCHSTCMEKWQTALQKENFKMVDVSAAFSHLISPKDVTEINTIRNGSQKMTEFFKTYVLPALVKGLNKKILLDEKLPGKAEKVMKNNKYLLPPNFFMYCLFWSKCCWSNGRRVMVIRRKSLQPSDTIICSIESRYKSYFCTLTRTFLLNPTDTMRQNYEFLLKLEEELLKHLKAGIKIHQVYEAGLELVRTEKPDLVYNLPHNFGFAMGIELMEPSMAIAPETMIMLKKNMVFQLNVGLSNLVNEQETENENKFYSLFIEDTVLVNEDEPATVLTSSSPKELEDLIVFLEAKNEDSIDLIEENLAEEEGRKKRKIYNAQQPHENIKRRRLLRDTTQQPKFEVEPNKENLNYQISLKEKEARKKRKVHQEQLAEKVHENMQRRRLLQNTIKETTPNDEETKKGNSVRNDMLILSLNDEHPTLTDIFIRPNIYSETITGNLEAHSNGFRYTSVRGDKIDIFYSDVKKAFFQSSDVGINILLHFHLKHDIMFDEKNYIDLQFFKKIVGNHDGNGFDNETAEKDLRDQLNDSFKSFCENVQNMKSGFKFDAPIRELAFHGVLFESMALLQPTSDCLVSLVEWPAFVLSLEDVELVQLSRVLWDSEEFDATFIFKDYSVQPAIIKNISKAMLEKVEEWLDSRNIMYSEVGFVYIPDWLTHLKHIAENLDEFLASGGWSEDVIDLMKWGDEYRDEEKCIQQKRFIVYPNSKLTFEEHWKNFNLEADMSVIERFV